METAMYSLSKVCVYVRLWAVGGYTSLPSLPYRLYLYLYLYWNFGNTIEDCAALSNDWRLIGWLLQVHKRRKYWEVINFPDILMNGLYVVVTSKCQQFQVKILSLKLPYLNFKELSAFSPLSIFPKYNDSAWSAAIAVLNYCYYGGLVVFSNVR